MIRLILLYSIYTMLVHTVQYLNMIWSHSNVHVYTQYWFIQYSTYTSLIYRIYTGSFSIYTFSLLTVQYLHRTGICNTVTSQDLALLYSSYTILIHIVLKLQKMAFPQRIYTELVLIVHDSHTFTTVY